MMCGDYVGWWQREIELIREGSGTRIFAGFPFGVFLRKATVAGAEAGADGVVFVFEEYAV